MYELRDTFNDRTISRHRTLAKAARAELAHDRAVRRANGSSSYIPTEILLDGAAIDGNELDRARDAAYYVDHC